MHNKITDVLEDRYIVETKFAKRSAILFEHESRYHLWTIEDAKDGDVLLFEGYYNSIVLFQGIGINGKGRINYHCKCDLGNYSFGVQGDMACLGTIEKDAEHYHPATKEQRDLLFQKMKEEGYEWDANKKKLNKIHVIDEGKAEMDYCFTKMMNGEKVSSAWSEEDEKMVKDIIAAIDTLYYHGMVNWLKSLKDRVQHQNKWKPSKEQIIALRWVLNNIPYNKHKEEISELLDQIKDL